MTRRLSPLRRFYNKYKMETIAACLVLLCGGSFVVLPTLLRDTVEELVPRPILDLEMTQPPVSEDPVPEACVVATDIPVPHIVLDIPQSSKWEIKTGVLWQDFGGSSEDTAAWNMEVQYGTGVKIIGAELRPAIGFTLADTRSKVYGAAVLEWRLGKHERWFVAPGVGFAWQEGGTLHTTGTTSSAGKKKHDSQGHTHTVGSSSSVDSSWLFRGTVEGGYRFNDTWSLSVLYEYASGGSYNEGMNSVGLRVGAGF